MSAAWCAPGRKSTVCTPGTLQDWRPHWKRARHTLTACLRPSKTPIFFFSAARQAFPHSRCTCSRSTRLNHQLTRQPQIASRNSSRHSSSASRATPQTWFARKKNPPVHFCACVLICPPMLLQKLAFAVAFFLAVDGRPMSTVSTAAFPELCTCMGFQAPSRDYITRLITEDLALEADMFMMKSLAGAATLSKLGWRRRRDGISHCMTRTSMMKLPPTITMSCVMF